MFSLGLVAAAALADPLFETAGGVGTEVGRTPAGGVEGAAILHEQTFGDLRSEVDDAGWPKGTYGASGWSLGVGNAGLSLEGKGDAGLLIRPPSVFFPAVGLDLGLGLRADTAHDQRTNPSSSDDWIQAEVDVAGGFGFDAGNCSLAALGRIGAAAGGEGVPGHGVQFGPLAQLDCPGIDLAVAGARTEKAHTDGRPLDLVDTASAELAVVIDRRHGWGIGIRGEGVALDGAYGFDRLDTRGMFFIEKRPAVDESEDEPTDSAPAARNRPTAQVEAPPAGRE